MSQRNGVITLPSFLKKYFHKKRMDEGEMLRYYTIAADGLSQLHMYHLPIIKSALLTIDGTYFTAPYPEDYVNYVLIGVESDGSYWTFTRKPSMVDKTIEGIDGSDLSDNNDTLGYGSVGGQNLYYFNVDHSGRRFLFDEAYTNQVVVLKYKSSGVEATDPDSTSTIEFPIYAEAALEAYIEHYMAESNKESLGERQWKLTLYNKAVAAMRTLHQPSIREIRDLWAGSSNQTIIR